MRWWSGSAINVHRLDLHGTAAARCLRNGRQNVVGHGRAVRDVGAGGNVPGHVKLRQNKFVQLGSERLHIHVNQTNDDLAGITRRVEL